MYDDIDNEIIIYINSQIPTQIRSDTTSKFKEEL